MEKFWVKTSGWILFINIFLSGAGLALFLEKEGYPEFMVLGLIWTCITLGATFKYEDNLHPGLLGKKDPGEKPEYFSK